MDWKNYWHKNLECWVVFTQHESYNSDGLTLNIVSVIVAVRTQFLNKKVVSLRTLKSIDNLKIFQCTNHMIFNFKIFIFLICFYILYCVFWNFFKLDQFVLLFWNWNKSDLGGFRINHGTLAIFSGVQSSCSSNQGGQSGLTNKYKL